MEPFSLKGAEELAVELALSDSLRELIPSSKIGDKGAAAIAKAGGSLTHLALGESASATRA